MNEEIIYMLDRFPKHRKIILKAYNGNDEFKSLCQDFYSSARTIENYKNDMIKNLKGELEYQRVFADLEKEIVEYLYSGDNEKNAS
jgi:hypothetical protein